MHLLWPGYLLIDVNTAGDEIHLLVYAHAHAHARIKYTLILYT
jgi:hypothetical protein